MRMPRLTGLGQRQVGGTQCGDVVLGTSQHPSNARIGVKDVNRRVALGIQHLVVGKPVGFLWCI